jgi:hypothetical protein
MFKGKSEGSNITLSDRSTKRLHNLMDLSGSESPEECLRNAMRLLDQCIEWAETGNTFAIVTPEGSVIPVSIFVDRASVGKPKFQVVDGGKKFE